MNLYLLEPNTESSDWAPFGGVSPVAELRVGAFRIRERWERVFGRPVTAIIDKRLAGYTDVDSPSVEPSIRISGPAIVADAGFAPSLLASPVDTFSRLSSQGPTVVSGRSLTSARARSAGCRTRMRRHWPTATGSRRSTGSR